MAEPSDPLWLKPLHRHETGPVVFAFPPAGAGPGVFRPWRNESPSGFEVVTVHAPGREERFREQPHRSVSTLAPIVAREVEAYLAARPGRPFAIFGHSAGAHLGRAVARQVGGAPLLALFVAAAVPPDRLPPDRSQAPDEDLVQALVEWGGTPRAVLDNAELLAMFLPVLRADLAVMASARAEWSEPEMMDVPIVALAGSEDRFAAPEVCQSWAGWTAAEGHLHVVEGGHFFPVTAAADVLDLIRTHLG